MKVAHVTACYRAADGVGNTLHEKIEASRAAGDAVRVFVERGAPPVPEAHRPLSSHIDLADLLDERAGGPSEGFFEQDLHLFQFLHPYPLMRAALLLDRGAMLFEYPGLTPLEHYRHEEHFRSLQERAGPAFRTLVLADAVLVHSRSMARELASLVPEVEDRVRVLRLAVNSEVLAEADGGRARLPDPGSGPRVLYVGRFAGNKRVDLLLRAFARFRSAHPGAHLFLVGDRETPPYDRYGAEVDGLIEELDLGGAVRCLGRLGDRELADVYAAVDLFATGTLHEGFCLPAAEAMTLGVPVAGFASTALPEVVEDAGVLAEEVGDPEALAAAMGAAYAGREALGERAKARARAYSREAFRGRYRSLLEEFLPLRDVPRLQGRRELMEAVKDTPIHYEDRCDRPWVGALVSAVRRRLTLHFEKFYVRKVRRMQGLFNDLALQELRELRARLEALEARRGDAEGDELPDAEEGRPGERPVDPS